MRPTAIPALIVALVASAARLAAQAGPFTPTQHARLDALFAPYAAPDAPGCAVGIAEGPGVSVVRGYGAADIEHGIPVSPETPFNLGSVGKQVTALATLLLAESGTLSLDDPVSRHVPGVPAGGGTIRVRHLLEHTSGLRDVDGISQLSGEHPRTMSEFLAQLRRQRTTQFPVGSRQEYSHSEYTLLSEVIAAASEMSYGRFLDSAVFVPLGMRHARVHDAERRLIPGRAEGYRVDDDGTIHTAALTSELVGNSNVFASAEDMLRWGSSALVTQLFVPPETTAERPMAYRYGLWHERHRGEPIIVRKGHGGSHSSGFLRMPGRDLTVAVLCNRANVDMVPLLLATADIRLDDLPPAAADPRLDTIPPPPGEAARLAGTYAVEHEEWMPIRIEAVGDRLVETFAGERFGFARLRDGRWTSDGLTYLFQQDGAEMRLVMSGPDVYTVGIRQPTTAEWHPSRATLAALVGRYESDEALATWSLVLAGDSLWLDRRGQDSVVLRPVVRDVFSATTLTASGYPTEIGIEVVRDAQGRVTGVRASAIPSSFEAARGLWFARSR